MPVRPAIIPNLHYADAPAAIDFLCAAFGFQRHAVHSDPADATRIAHAQLLHAGQMVMLSSALPTPFAEAARMRTPCALGGVTQVAYIVLDDVDAHAARAIAAGAEIVTPPEDQSYGGRGYSARDPEGHVWSFGSYDPFAG